MNWKLGRKAKLYYGALLAAIADMSVAGNVKDVTVGLPAEMIDITTRGSEAFKSEIQGHKSITVEFEMIWDVTDPAFTALRAAYLSGEPLEIAALTDAYNATNVDGPKGAFSVSKFTRKEGLKDAVLAEVGLSLTTYREWVNGGGSSPVAPAITSSSPAAFTEGTFGSYTIISTGTPKATVARVGSLPAGLAWNDNGDGTVTILGVPSTGTHTASPYALALTAANGVSPNATQALTVSVSSGA